MVRLALGLLLLVGGGATAHAWTCPGIASEPYEPRTFLGYACADDCRRHKAGFAWAERHRVTDAAACDGLELLQAGGCRAVVEEGARPEAAGDRVDRARYLYHDSFDLEQFFRRTFRHRNAPKALRPPRGWCDPTCHSHGRSWRCRR